MIAPQLAPVKPHIASPLTGEPLLLEDYVSLRIERGFPFTLNVCGSLGSGRRTAIRHLGAITFPHSPLLHDGYDLVGSDGDRRFVVQANRKDNLGDCVYLLPWTNDDLIEYVLSLDHANAKGIIHRSIDLGIVQAIHGKPGLCRMVVDALLDDLSHETTSDCLRHAIRKMLRSDRNYTRAARYCLFQTRPRGIPRDVIAILQLRSVQNALAAELAVTRLHPRLMRWYPSKTVIYPDLLSEIIELAKRDALIVPSLHRYVNECPTAFVMSVLHAVDPDWQPDGIQKLTGALLNKASWPGIDLTNVEANVVDLRWSDLHGGAIKGTTLRRSKLDHCNLSDSQLVDSSLMRVSAGHARFCDGFIDQCDFQHAKLDHSDFTAASVSKCNFDFADLSGASFRDAQIRLHCHFDDTILSGADFTGSRNARCMFRRVDFREAELNETKFSRCMFHRCNFEFATIRDANFDGSSFAGSDLTGSRMRRVILRDVNLRETGLADIDWEGTDLRGANLRGCAFHMGSSRCGMVGSPYPGHGSKTGFYTNDFDDIWHRPPEAIRKANLCGADLRGAIVYDTDFYLVDLRGALYDESQRDHFVRCDAILSDRQS